MTATVKSRQNQVPASSARLPVALGAVLMSGIAGSFGAFVALVSGAGLKAAILTYALVAMVILVSLAGLVTVRLATRRIASAVETEAYQGKTRA